ncbi:MAG: outer membrane protein assembly factor BamD [Lentimonas sp.]|jgi:outer membrane protein assembly factor BamD
MRRTYFILFSLWLALAASAHAGFMQDTFGWLLEQEGESTQLRGSTASDEASAGGLLASAKEKLEAGRNRSAARYFKKIIKKFPDSSAAGEALFLQARMEMADGKWISAFDLLQRITQEHPGFKDYDKVIGSQFDCATALMEGARGRIFWIFPGFKQYSKAVEEFMTIVENAPYNDYAPLALMNISLIAEKQNRPEEAIDALDRLINYYPQSMLAPDAYYNLAQTYANLVKGSEYDQGSTRQAISYYEDFLILFPKSNFTGEVESRITEMENLLATSRLNLGNFFYFYRSNSTAALIFYNEAITIAPKSEAAADARLRIKDIKAGVRPVNSASLVRRLLIID